MIGRVLGGRYEIIESIDSGGMAYIYKALCKKTGNYVAVKVLKEKFSKSTEYVNRFKKEAAAAFSLDHEGIVHVTDIGCDDGAYYMVMEIIEGPTLKALIERQTVIDEKDAILYAIQICSALSAAHKRGIIHRDIKPQNILINKDNNAKVTDFGIAKSLLAKPENETQVIGSVFYISPEQARGDNVDTRSDVYSLGIMLYEMLTGELPYTGDKTISVALKHINEQMVPPSQKNPNISASINNIVLKATSKNKRDRYRSMDTFKEDLVRALVDPSGAYVDVHVAQQLSAATRALTDKNNRLWKICILVLLIFGVAAVMLFSAEAISQATQKSLVISDLTGMNIEMASSELAEMNLQQEIIFEPSETVAKNVVIGQSPTVGNTVTDGDTVILTVSSGPSDRLMPDVYNMSLEEAQLLIEQMGLVVGSVEYTPDEDVPIGNVILQSPEADSVVLEGDTVSLVVCGESAPSGAMPPLTDMSLEQAVILLNETGFTNCYVYEQESELPEGTVMSQSPEKGIQTPYTNDVYVWASEYKAKEYGSLLNTVIDVTEKESTVRVVIEDNVGSVHVHFIQEMRPEVGLLTLNYELFFLSGGEKTVKVFVNNDEVYTDKVVAEKWGAQADR